MCEKLLEIPKDIHRQEETIPYINEDLKCYKKKKKECTGSEEGAVMHARVRQGIFREETS